MKAADHAWVACALLHEEHGPRTTFTPAQIRDKAVEIGDLTVQPASIRRHAWGHCVANRHPDPHGYRMLFEEATGGRRLFRYGDWSHPDRGGGKLIPTAADLPPRWHYLIPRWEQEWSHLPPSQYQAE